MNCVGVIAVDVIIVITTTTTISLFFFKVFIHLFDSAGPSLLCLGLLYLWQVRAALH